MSVSLDDRSVDNTELRKKYADILSSLVLWNIPDTPDNIPATKSERSIAALL